MGFCGKCGNKIGDVEQTEVDNGEDVQELENIEKK